MIVYKNEYNCWSVGPDFVRLKRKFQVPNGVSDITKENHVARSLSYLQMLGASKRATEVLEKLNFSGVQLHKWYNEYKVTEALAIKYEMSINEI